MTELADVQDLGSCAFRRVGSSPTNRRKIVTVHRFPANCNIRSPHLKFCFAKGGLLTPESLSYAAKQQVFHCWVNSNDEVAQIWKKFILILTTRLTYDIIPPVSRRRQQVPQGVSFKRLPRRSYTRFMLWNFEISSPIFAKSFFYTSKA